MNLPDGVSFHPRQTTLISRSSPAIIQIEDKGRFRINERYFSKDYHFDTALAPCLHGDWEKFDRDFYLKRTQVIYSRASHGTQHYPADPQLPDILVVPNLDTEVFEERAQDIQIFGCTMGNKYPRLQPQDYRTAEIYEFQSYGFLMLDRQEGEVEMWVAQDGDKVAVPVGSHATLYNLGNQSQPLIALSFYGRTEINYNRSLVELHGPILLAYYNPREVVFKLSRRYLNNHSHDAGVRFAVAPEKDEDRTIRIARGARLDMGRMLYEQLTQNPALIGRFANLGIRIKPASPEAALEPNQAERAVRLFFSLPLVKATHKGTEVYRHFIPDTEAAKAEVTPELSHPSARVETAPAPEPEPVIARKPLDRPLVIVVEGVGDWVGETYHPLFKRKVEQLKKKAEEENRPAEKPWLSVFYTDDSRWKKAPKWVETDLQPWETYLDKALGDDYARYHKLRPDVVFIVTPDFTHSALARHWLNKVPLVLVEKPFDSHVKNVDELRRAFKHPSPTEVLGLDHYQFYALPIEKLKAQIDKHLGYAIKSVEFYLTENRPIEYDREMSLQHGLTLDLLPHLLALLTYFGDIVTIDDIAVSEAGRYQPLISKSRDNLKEADISERFHSETYSRVRFTFQSRYTFQDSFGTPFHIPCTAVVGKGFSIEAKYLEITGVSGHSIRVDLKSQPENDVSGYPWDSLFFLQGEKKPLDFPNVTVHEVPDPYRTDNILKILDDPSDPNNLTSSNDQARFHHRLFRSRYEKLLDDLLDDTTKAVRSTLTLAQGQNIVRALDRIWWAIQAAKAEWKDFQLGQQNPFELVPDNYSRNARARRRLPEAAGDKTLVLPIRMLGDIQVYDEREGENRPRHSVRTRGPIVTSEVNEPLPDEDLVKLFDQLRGQVSTLPQQANALPLTLVVQDWKSPAAKQFLSQLKELDLLRRDDVIWLVSLDGAEADDVAASEQVIRGMPQTIEINLRKDTDEHLLRNLVADLVFTPGMDKTEMAQGPDDPPSPTSPPPAALGDEIPEMDEIGKRLAEETKQMASLENRRAQFQTLILRVMDSSPGRSDWGLVFARQANLHQWPEWAVECLPNLYIMLEPTRAQTQRAMVWKELLGWLPTALTYEGSGEPGAEQLREIEAPIETATWLADFAQVLGRNLWGLPLANDYSFKVAVHQSMLEVEHLFEERLPEALAAFRKKREYYFQQMLQSRD